MSNGLSFHDYYHLFFILTDICPTRIYHSPETYLSLSSLLPATTGTATLSMSSDGLLLNSTGTLQEKKLECLKIWRIVLEAGMIAGGGGLGLGVEPKVKKVTIQFDNSTSYHCTAADGYVYIVAK